MTAAMTWYAPPRDVPTTVFARLPDALRRPGRASAWGSANKGGPVDSFLEGPAFDAAGNLWCTDIPWGRVFRVDAAGTFHLVTEYDGEPNGLAFSPAGVPHIADHARGILRLDPATGAVTPLLERRRGEHFKGPNDLVFAADGTLYFTDQGQTGLQDPTGRVWRLFPDGRLELLLGNIPSPNGLALDEASRALFVAVTRANQVWRVPLPPEGGTAKVHAFVTLSGGVSGPDGLALDEAGGLVIAHASLGTVWRVSRLGEPELRIRSATGMYATNMAYGGPDRRTLFITESESGTILAATLDRRGKALPYPP